MLHASYLGKDNSVPLLFHLCKVNIFSFSYTKKSLQLKVQLSTWCHRNIKSRFQQRSPINYAIPDGVTFCSPNESTTKYSTNDLELYFQHFLGLCFIWKELIQKHPLILFFSQRWAEWTVFVMCGRRGKLVRMQLLIWYLGIYCCHKTLHNVFEKLPWLVVHILGFIKCTFF